MATGYAGSGNPADQVWPQGALKDQYISTYHEHPKAEQVHFSQIYIAVCVCNGGQKVFVCCISSYFSIPRLHPGVHETGETRSGLQQYHYWDFITTPCM